MHREGLFCKDGVADSALSRTKQTDAASPRSSENCPGEELHCGAWPITAHIGLRRDMRRGFCTLVLFIILVMQNKLVLLSF